MTLEARYWAKVDVRGPDECWPWLGGRNGDGYGCIRDENMRMALAHRVALRFDGRDPAGLVSLHSCDNPACQNPRHLRAGTQLENLREMSARGRHVGTRKLSAAEVSRIRAANGVPQRALAERFNVSQATISEVRSGRTWQESRAA